MLIELPERFKLSFVEVVQQELLLYNLVRFEDIMYELTYALREMKCLYCNQPLNRKDSTLDHRYPRHYGGVSITNNLFPCCTDCNTGKSNLSHEEYIKIQKLSKKERKKYLNKISVYNERTMRKIGFKLPKKWITFEKLSNIGYQNPIDILRGKKYYRLLEFYKNYKKLSRPIIIDNNNTLLDGYNVVLFARDLELEQIPVIKLENVKLLLD